MLSEMVRDAFEAFGFRGTYLTAATVGEGRAILGDVATYPTIDLIISDMHLPDGSGLDLVHGARSNPARLHVPVVISVGRHRLAKRWPRLCARRELVCGQERWGRSPGQTVRALYEHWLQDARLPALPITTRTHR